MQEALKKAKDSPLSKPELLSILKRERDFIGIFASDQLRSLYVLKEPVFMIVNIDISSQPGSHWIALRVGKSTIEIWDSLGFNKELWSSYPDYLIKFLERYRMSHTFYISPILQSPNSYVCGLYCVFFILYRPSLSFSNCVGRFSINLAKNKEKLYYLLNKKIR